MINNLARMEASIVQCIVCEKAYTWCIKYLVKRKEIKVPKLQIVDQVQSKATLGKKDLTLWSILGLWI